VLAHLLVAAVEIYLGLGLVFAAAFVTVGVGRLDPAARGTSALFRFLLLPGAVALWPVLAHHWWKGLHT
jgi:hypothetical protein